MTRLRRRLRRGKRTHPEGAKSGFDGGMRFAGCMPSTIDSLIRWNIR